MSKGLYNTSVSQSVCLSVSLYVCQSVCLSVRVITDNRLKVAPGDRRNILSTIRSIGRAAFPTY